jgi:hypothetical protein
MHRAHRFEPLSRTISLSEYEAVLKIMNDVRLENGWRQGMGADKIYLPDFKRKGHPFALKH